MKRDIILKGFSKRLIAIRKERGLTQTQLAKAIGTSPRMIAYYEHHVKNIPSHVILKLAKALKVSADELLGLKEIKHIFNPEYANLWRRFKKVETLSLRDRRALFHYLNALLEKPKYQSK
jgi:transcriptional regulator with XRE-family HTH domain